MTASAPLRAVLDTNILVPLLLSPRGLSAELRLAIYDGRCEIVTSEAILAELAEVMHRPALRARRHYGDDVLDELIQAFRKRATVVAGDYEVFVVTNDPKDNPIMACALEGAAEYVVTEDREHLLPLKHWRGIQIISLAAFIRVLRNR